MPRRKYTTLEQELPNLGVEPDNVIARRMGVSRQYLAQVRWEQGIEAVPVGVKPEGKAPRSAVRQRLTDVEELSFYVHVPLSDEQRDLLKRRRLELGLSQSALSKEAEVYQHIISAIESGNIPDRANPTPEVLSRLCQALGIELNTSLSVSLQVAE